MTRALIAALACSGALVIGEFTYAAAPMHAGNESGASSVVIAQAAAAPAPAPTAVPPAPRFDIERFDVQGNSLLSADEINAAVARYTGTSKDFADVQRALESLQHLYQSRGFGTVQVLLPEQELERGVIVLKVIEPKLGKVAVEGNKFFSDENIRRSLPSLKEGAVPNANDIGVEARLASDNPAKRTTVLLRAGENEGEVNATVRVQDERPWRAVVSFDNTGTPTSGDYRLGFAYQHSNLFDLDHALTLQYQLNPVPPSDWDELKIFGAAYRIPFYEHGASLDLLFGYSSQGAANGEVIQGQAFNISGSGTIAGVRYNRILPRLTFIDDYEHRVALGFDYKAFTNQVAQVDSGVQGSNLTPDVTVYPASLTYYGTKRMENAEFSLYAGVARNMYAHGPDAFKERFYGPPGEGVRPGVGEPYYTVWRYGMNYLRALPYDIQMRLNFTGQYTRDALVPGEQFGLGGWDNLRGMIEREGSNDRGWRGTFEVYSPDLGRDGTRLRLLAFVDTGSLRQNHAPDPISCGATACGFSATSVGVGVRMAMRNGISLRLDWGQMRDPGVDGSSGEDRIHFGLAISF